jgi:cysteinyl-tRNA synthetase
MKDSILDAIGNTPVVEIQRMNPVAGVRIFAKLEYMNPGGSVKDRAALFMIQAGEASGRLTKNKTVIEATSGNTGIGLAMICAVKGYRLALTMAENASEERKRILRARGAKIILTPRHLGSDGAIEEAYRLARENPDKYYITDQYNNPANWQAHYHTTAPEIMAQVPEKPASVVASVGTSGTLMGLSRYFREHCPNTRIVCAEPFLGHGIQGLKNMKESYTPEIYDKKRLDRVLHIDDDLAFETARQLASMEGLFVGMSSGAAMAAALIEAQTLEKGVVVVIFPDSGERYLSTPLFSVKHKLQLHLFDSLAGKKQQLKPVKSDTISIYTCGPTVHQRLHPGRFRRYVFTDLLVRYLTFHKMDVNHVVNITDYDDRVIEGAVQAGLDLDAFTRPHVKMFHQDLKRLKIRPARAYPRVSDHVGDMAELTRTLLNRGHAYEKLHSVYFDITSVPEYGHLSKMDIQKVRLGATVDLDEYEKHNPRDFTLFKRVRLSELRRGIGMKTEWGQVRPSLHLQCATLSMLYLGTPFDIHTGSRELVFPHHENEQAIARAAKDRPLAGMWLHCDPVRYDGSLGVSSMDEMTLDTLADLGWDDRTIRFWLMSGHYRKGLVLSKRSLGDARATLAKINRCIALLEKIRSDATGDRETVDVATGGPDCPAGDAGPSHGSGAGNLATIDPSKGGPSNGGLSSGGLSSGGLSNGEIDQLVYDIRQGVLSALADDLKISAAIASLLACVKTINALINRSRVTPGVAGRILGGIKEMDQILQVCDFCGKKEYSREVEDLIRQREAARQKKDWAAADRIREKLSTMGVSVHDKKTGAQ